MEEMKNLLEIKDLRIVYDTQDGRVEALNGASLTGDALFLWDAGEAAGEIHTGRRIGVDYAREAAGFPWRFWL